MQLIHFLFPQFDVSKIGRRKIVDVKGYGERLLYSLLNFLTTFFGILLAQILYCE